MSDSTLETLAPSSDWERLAFGVGPGLVWRLWHWVTIGLTSRIYWVAWPHRTIVVAPNDPLPDPTSRRVGPTAHLGETLYLAFHG